jgi:thiol-disulfide isomerase/thioredoxin
MVDWDQVEKLHKKGLSWEQIAEDPKVEFHADSEAGSPGRALRALYYRRKSREGRRPSEKAPKPSAEEKEKQENRWTLPRIGYLLTPLLLIWLALAYVAPSPVGLIVPAFPYLALVAAVAAFILFFGLWRSTGPKWKPQFRKALTVGIVLGFLVSGLIGLTAILAFGCPYLPPASTLASQAGPGWTSASVSPWQDSGKPVLYFYGASWCPYCSASSWSIWKALTEFGTVTGYYTSYSSSTDVYASTPEMVLASTSISSSTISFEVSEDTSGVDGNFPTTSNCVQQAYVAAYSGSSIPFVAVNGQYIHGGQSLNAPSSLASWAGGNNGGASAVQTSVSTESGTPWTAVQTQAWWIMAFLAKASGQSVASLSAQYHWSSGTTSAVQTDYAQIT